MIYSLKKVILGSLLLTSFFSTFAAYNNIEIKRVVAAGLTYKGHLKETGFKIDPTQAPPFLNKDLKSISFKNSSDRIKTPDQRIIEQTLNSLEKNLYQKWKDSTKRKEFPLMLDYEAEFALFFPQTISRSQIEGNGSSSILVKIGIINDLSARGIQILGEGQKEKKLDYWAAAKSFSSFLPLGEFHTYELPLQEWPSFTISSYVDNKLRQKESTSEIIYTPQQLLLYLIKHINFENSIPKGTLFLTGTPSGVAFKVNKLTRFLGHFLSRFLKLKISAKKSDSNPRFLKPSQQVKVELLDENGEKISSRTTYIQP